MAVIAAQLEAVVSATGVTTTQAQLEEMGAAADGAGVALDSISGAASGAGAGLDTAGTGAAGAGTGFDTLAGSADAAATALSGVDGALSTTAGAADTAAAGATDAGGGLDVLAGSADVAAASVTGVDTALGGADVAMATSAASADATATQFSVLGTMSDSTASSMKSFIGGIPLLAAAAVVAVGALSVKMAGDFQESMTQLVTGAGESKSNLDMVSQGVLNMAVTTGTSTKDLSDGLYMIESAGQHGAQGLETLKIAAEAAKVGNASLADVANGVTTAMTDYAGENLTAAQAANTLIATVASGKTHMQDLSQALSTILPVASSVGVSFNNVMAAMATMTGEGVPAADAATYLRQTLMSLENPSTKGAAALKSIGLTSGQVASEMKKSLPDALKMITEHLAKKFPVGSQKYIAALSAISGGTKQMQGMLDLTGKHLSTFDKNVKTIAASVKHGGKSVTGWSETQKDFNFQMAQAGEILQTGMIRAGTALMPIVSKLVSGFVSFVGTMSRFVGWLSKGSAGATIVKGVLAGLALGVLAFVATAIPPLLVAFGAWAVAAGSAALMTIIAAAPFIAVGLAIGILVAGIVLAIQHWGAIVKFFEGLWKTVWGAVSSFFKTIWNDIKSFFTGIWNGIVAFFTGAVKAVVNFVKSHWQLLVAIIGGPIVAIVLLIITHWNQIKAFFITIWNDIKRLFMVALNFLIAQVTTFVSDFVRGFTRLWDRAKGIATSLWADVVGVFNAAIGRVKTSITNIWNGIVSIVTTWPAKALQWGKDLIQNLINGITGMVGGIKNAVGSIAKSIAGFLHFSKPDVGPLRDVDKWMPDMGDKLAKSLTAQIPKLSAAVNLLVKPVSSTLSGIGGALPRMPSGAAMLPSSTPAQADPYAGRPIILQIDSTQFARVVMPLIAQQLRYRVGVGGR